MSRSMAVLAAAVVGSMAPAHAQERQAPAPPADKPLLSGPKVEPAGSDAEPTLVQRDFAGKIVRLEVPPAEAAVRLVELDDATRQKVDAVLLERARLMDGLVTGNLELLVKLQAAREGNDAAESRRLLGELTEKAAPLRERGMLMQDLAKVLSPEQAARVRALAEEYWNALVNEEVAARGASGDAAGDRMEEQAPAQSERRARGGAGGRGEAGAVRRELALAMIGAEVRRAYERTIGAASRDFDQLLKDLNVTPEQESRIRKVVGDSFQKNYGKSSARERARVFGEVWRTLDAGQRARFAERLRGDEAPK